MQVAIIAMGDNIAGRLLDDANTWLSDKWAVVFDPIYVVWIPLLIVFILVMGVISYFAPFTWVKQLNGFLVAIAVAFVAGGWKGSRAYKTRFEEERRKRKEAEATRNRRDDGGGGGDSGGWNPFNWR